MKELFDKLYNKSEESFYKILDKNLKENKKTFIVTANPETFMMSEKDTEMRDLLLDKDTILVPDGIGIVKAARMINYDIKERIAGIDIANKLLELGNKQKKSIYLFGAKQEVIDSMKEVLKNNYPNLKEGEMTKVRATVVCEDSLYKIAEKHNFSDFLYVGNRCIKEIKK